jgi:hypothetical protein
MPSAKATYKAWALQAIDAEASLLLWVNVSYFFGNSAAFMPTLGHCSMAARRVAIVRMLGSVHVGQVCMRGKCACWTSVYAGQVCMRGKCIERTVRAIGL